MRRPGRVLCVIGGALFLASLFLPCVDDDYGEFASGSRVEGYQCLVGLPLMPMVVPLATPLWLALLAGNLWAIAAPWLALFHRTPRRFSWLIRWLALASVVALLVLTSFRGELGLKAIHVGYASWVASVVLVSVGAWLPWKTETES